MKKVDYVAQEMVRSGINKNTVFQFLLTSVKYEGVEDLILMWGEEEDENEREEIVKDLIESVKEKEGVFRR